MKYHRKILLLNLFGVFLNIFFYILFAYLNLSNVVFILGIAYWAACTMNDAKEAFDVERIYNKA